MAVNALPILLLGGAALLMMGGKKKNGGLKALSGGEGDVVIDGKTAGWFLEPSVGGKTQEWRWVIFDKGGDGRSMESSEGEFATEEEAREDLLRVGLSKGWKFKKPAKTNGKTTSEGDPTIDGGSDTGTPWFLMVNYSAKTQVEERAKACSNPQAFRDAVLPAIDQRVDEYRHDNAAANYVGFGENEPGGLAFRSDLQMLVDNLFTMHCG
jgi:hypothetical protein